MDGNWPTIVHLARERTADLIESIGNGIHQDMDFMTISNWELALLDLTVTVTTGKTLGEWTYEGADRLADYVRGRSRKENVRDWAKVIDHPTVAYKIQPYVKAITKHFMGDKWIAITAEAPQDAAAFAQWAHKTAADLKMSTVDFLALRMVFSPDDNKPDW